MEMFLKIKRFNFFINKQISDLKIGGFKTLSRKFIVALKLLSRFVNPLYYVAILIVIFLRLISPFFIVRWETLTSVKIGHFTTNTELYCCKRDVGINVPAKLHIDFFCFGRYISNKQLALMWSRKLNILPRFFLSPIIRINRILSIFIPGGLKHEIHNSGNINVATNREKIDTDRDIYNLLVKTDPHLCFTDKEIDKGEKFLRDFGLSENSKIVCLGVRDSAYNNKYLGNIGKDWSYHNHRDQNIENYLPAAEKLAEKGYYVFRMGKIVNKPMNSSNSKIIDYANSGIRNDFLDIYLAYKCKFCIRTDGFGGVPKTFRKPLVIIEGPLVDLEFGNPKNVLLSPHYYSIKKGKTLSLSETFAFRASDIRTSQGYKNLGIEVKNNTSEEIKDVVIEMAERLEGIWKPN